MPTNQTLAQFTDINAVDQTGQYVVPNAANAPTGSAQWIYLDVETWGYGNAFALQRATELNPGGRQAKTWQRVKQDGSWGAWDQVASAAYAQGSGSGSGSGSGIPGPQGPAGPQGPVGPQGPAGTGGSGNLGLRVFNVVDYGAVSNGGDASAAFNAAFAALNDSPDGGVIYVPPGRFLIQNTLFGSTAKPFIFKGAGDASQIVLNGPSLANGIIMQQQTPNAALEVRDLLIFATGCPNLGNGSILSVIGVLQGCNGTRIENLHFRMTDDAPCSNVLLNRNTSSGVIRDVNIDGYSGWGEGNTANGIYIDADTQGANAVQLINCNIFRVYTGITCVGGQIHQYVMEGFEANECTIVGCQFGLHMQGGWYRVPGNGWRGGHINARQICIKLDTWMEFKVSDALLYLDGSAAANSQGFIIATDCDDINIHNCTTRYVDEITGGPTQRGIYGFAFVNTQNALVQGNFFDIGRADSAAVYAVPGTGCANIRTAFNTKRGGGGFGAGDLRSIGEDIVV